MQVYGAEQHDNRVGLWMELVRGESLEQTVQTRGPFGAREAALVGLDLCAALAAVHGAGLLHRDVKAQNVMRESGGRLVLMDFGTGEELAGTNRLVGTPLYLAPEIFRGQRASVQSDLYSLGVLLFYLVTGKFPVTAGSMEQLARAHAHRERQPLRDLRPDLPEALSRRSSARSTAIRAAATRASATSSRRCASRSTRRCGRPRPGAIAASAFRSRVSRRDRRARGSDCRVDRLERTPACRDGRRPSTALAILPLVDKSATGSSELSEALTEQLIATIGQVDSLRTTSLVLDVALQGQRSAAHRDRQATRRRRGARRRDHGARWFVRTARAVCGWTRR